MAVYINQPMFPVDFLRPKQARFDNPGSGFDGGVNGVGEPISVETSGGGIVTCTYSEMVLEGPDERFEVLNWLGARLNGGFRFINVPVVNDKIGPFPVIRGTRRPIITGIPHSDGSLFSDGSGYSQATVYGEVTEDAALNAGILSMRVYGASRGVFRWSDFFSIYHPTKGWRVYRSWELIDKTDEENPVYRLALAPPLREAVTAGTRVELARPRCVMKLPKGVTIPWEYSGWYSSRPTVQFTEAF
ncbi:hypothetical protein [Rhizobium leguminosarum]|uniref:hypothetical protein n=1 Tax=Rhizobium leguminosarum TaxID=384 RepID=UPI001C9613A8|nr:hypothetical protein [Rhizobium leguminosarum]MBY5465291.1 hypothetical protein [Rhizobium leguminosarum]